MQAAGLHYREKLSVYLLASRITLNRVQGISVTALLLEVLQLGVT